jgi:hypothetical protein
LPKKNANAKDFEFFSGINGGLDNSITAPPWFINTPTSVPQGDQHFNSLALSVPPINLK